jgi:phytoene/squalene synthetase
MYEFYEQLTFKISRLVTKSYSTSFSAAVSLLDNESRDAIYSIYGFVRFADEIVDSFHDHDKKYLLEKFEDDYYEAFSTGISLNPVLHSFQKVVKKYNIGDDLIQAFLKSMRTDLLKKDFNTVSEMEDYVYGSAEVVGLMCLKIFVKGNSTAYSELEIHARKLGSAFQKVNFLRDLKNDIEYLERRYFPELIGSDFNEMTKSAIISDIEKDFKYSYEGIRKLPKSSRIGVLTAYNYYLGLLKKIRTKPAEMLLEKRIRIPDHVKWMILVRSYLMNKLDLV